MNFEPSDHQRELCAAVREYGRSLNDGLIERDAEGTFDRAAWRRCAEFGIHGLPVPAEYGGTGQDLLTTLFSLNAQMWAFELPLVHFGNEEQKRRFLPSVCSGGAAAPVPGWRVEE